MHLVLLIQKLNYSKEISTNGVTVVAIVNTYNDDDTAAAADDDDGDDDNDEDDDDNNLDSTIVVDGADAVCPKC